MGWRRNEYDSGLLSILNRLVYFQTKIKNEDTGKFGIIDSCDKILVPPIFDDCVPNNDIHFCETLIKVKENGKWYLSSLDGTGKVIPDKGFDEISNSYCYGWVKRGAKSGLINMKSGIDIIPCEMDWTLTITSHAICIKDGLIGFANTIVPEDTEFISPRFKEVNLTTHQFLYQGKWVWVKGNGEISGNPLSFRDGIGFPWNFDIYLHDDPIFNSLALDLNKKNNCCSPIQGSQLTEEEIEDMLRKFPLSKDDYDPIKEFEEEWKEYEALPSRLNRPDINKHNEYALFQAIETIIESAKEHGSLCNQTILDGKDIEIQITHEYLGFNDYKAPWSDPAVLFAWREQLHPLSKLSHKILFADNNGIGFRLIFYHDIKNHLKYKIPDFLKDETEIHTLIKF